MKPATAIAVGVAIVALIVALIVVVIGPSERRACHRLLARMTSHADTVLAREMPRSPCGWEAK